MSGFNKRIQVSDELTEFLITHGNFKLENGEKIYITDEEPTFTRVEIVRRILDYAKDKELFYNEKYCFELDENLQFLGEPVHLIKNLNKNGYSQSNLLRYLNNHFDS